MSLLTICQAAAQEAQLDKPSAIIGSTGPDERRLLAHASRAVQTLARAHDWQALISETTFTTTATETQTGAIPSDFDRFVPDTIWDRTNCRQLRGPVSAVYFQRQLAVSTSTSDYDRMFRRRGGDFVMWPAAGAGDTIAFEYIVNTPVETSGGAALADWTNDTDVSKVYEDVLELGVIWRVKRAYGQPYDDDLNEYLAMVAQAWKAERPPDENEARFTDMPTSRGRYNIYSDRY